MNTSLQALGWADFFSEQLSIDENQRFVPMRVFGVQRNSLTLRGAQHELQIPLSGRWFQQAPEHRPTIGDWLLLDEPNNVVVRRLQRRSVLQRRSPGNVGERQLLGANVDLLFVVTSCNQDFNVRRLERYLAFAFAADVQPVLVLTKKDLTDDVEKFVGVATELAGATAGEVAVVAVNAKHAASAGQLQAWCGVGKTVAMMGSSGVGKSTLLNSLFGDSVQATGAVRADDAKGRHTTTQRSLHLLPSGGLVLDSPGIRELQIGDAMPGIQDLFTDIDELALGCRFSNCRHLREPNCAVRAALAAGQLDSDRLASFHKLRSGD